MSQAIMVNIMVGVSVAAILSIIGILLKRKLQEGESLKYEFITIIAHKFRTPLTQIKWTSEGLLSSEQDPYRRQALTDIGASNENLIKLTNTLVELTDSAGDAKSSYHIEKIDLCEMAKQAIDASKKQFHEKNMFMSMNCALPQIFVSVDRARMDFVVGTLLENACSYSPPGRNITVTASADDKKAALSVTDDGIGIDPRDMPFLFTKFFRSKAAQAADTEGLGVGLFLARTIVERHGGTLQGFSDGPDRGSTFSVILPRVK